MLICAFVVRIWQKQVFSCRGSFCGLCFFLLALLFPEAGCELWLWYPQESVSLFAFEIKKKKKRTQWEYIRHGFINSVHEHQWFICRWNIVQANETLSGCFNNLLVKLQRHFYNFWAATLIKSWRVKRVASKPFILSEYRRHPIVASLTWQQS